MPKRKPLRRTTRYIRSTSTTNRSDLTPQCLPRNYHSHPPHILHARFCKHEASGHTQVGIKLLHVPPTHRPMTHDTLAAFPSAVQSTPGASRPIHPPQDSRSFITSMHYETLAILRTRRRDAYLVSLGRGGTRFKALGTQRLQRVLGRVEASS